MVRRRRFELAEDITAEDIKLFLRMREAVTAKRLREQRAIQEKARRRLLDRYSGPLDLMIAMHPTWKRTPALEVISREFERAVATPGARVIVTMSPQEGKSQSVQAASLRALQHNPDCRIAYASYAEWLARRNAGEVRDLIAQHGSGAKDAVTGDPLPDLLGFGLNPDRAAEGRWQLGNGHRGAAVAVGLTSGLTGAAVDLLVVDDPVKDQQNADSETIRSRLHEWWSGVAETRLAPHTSVIVIQTRWHLDDLAGRLVSEDLALPEEERQWRVINIPALADGDAPDALEGVPGGRDENGWMVSARGDRVPTWDRLRRSRPRVFSAMYQGRPTPMAGGIFQASWIERGRVGVEGRPPAPTKWAELVVGVDPADTGKGDAAGVLVAGLDLQGHQYYLADYSGPLSQHQWGRKACIAWIRWDANRIVQETTLGMRNTVSNAWAMLRRQAAAIVAYGDVETASQVLQDAGDEVAAEHASLREVATLAQKIVDAPASGPRVVTIPSKQSKQVRAESATEHWEDGRAHVVGYLSELEFEMVTWQEGMASPARLDVMSMLTWHLERGGKSRVLV